MLRVEKLVLATIGAVAAASVVCFRWQSPTNPRAVNRGATEDPSQDTWAFKRPERIVEGLVLEAFAYLLDRRNSHRFSLGSCVCVHALDYRSDLAVAEAKSWGWIVFDGEHRKCVTHFRTARRPPAFTHS